MRFIEGNPFIHGPLVHGLEYGIPSLGWKRHVPPGFAGLSPNVIDTAEFVKEVVFDERLDSLTEILYPSLSQHPGS